MKQAEYPSFKAFPATYQVVLDSIPFPAWIKNTNSVYIEANQAFATFCQRARDEIIGKTDFDLWPPDRAQKFRDNDRELFSTASTQFLQETLITPDGREQHFKVFKTPVTDANGNRYGIIGVIKDVTAEVQAATALQQSEERFKAIFETVLDSLLILDDNGRYREVNPTACRLLGQSHEDIINKSHFEFLHGLSDAEYQALWAQFLTDGRMQGEIQMRKGDGTLLDVEFNAVANFQPGFHLAVMRDITARKKAEEELEKANHRNQLILDSAGEAIFGVDAEGRITFANPATEHLLGWAREEMIGQNIHQLAHHHYPDGTLYSFEACPLQQAILQELPFRYDGEYFIRKDGTFFPAELTIAHKINELDNVRGAVVVLRDVTERKQFEATIQEANEALEQRVQERTAELAAAMANLKQSERLRSTYISTLTHDLRTPLIAQQRILEVLMDDYATLNNQRMAYLTSGLYKNNEHLLQMVNRLLEVYEYEDGKVRLRLEAVNLHRLVQDCFDEIAEMARAKQIHLKNELSPQTSTVRADYHQLKRVFMNLLGNALENIGPGCTISLSAHDGKEAVEIIADDDGPGIPANLMPTLFDLDKGNRNHHQVGKGLGLYICKMIIERHGGTIQAESTGSQGTRFTIKLLKEPTGEDNA